MRMQLLIHAPNTGLMVKETFRSRRLSWWFPIHSYKRQNMSDGCKPQAPSTIDLSTWSYDWVLIEVKWHMDFIKSRRYVFLNIHTTGGLYWKYSWHINRYTPYAMFTQHAKGQYIALKYTDTSQKYLDDGALPVSLNYQWWTRTIEDMDDNTLKKQ